MRNTQYLVAVALLSASVLAGSSPEQPANKNTSARAQREQDADARVHKTPAQVEGSQAVARRLGDTCEGLVNPDLDHCVDGVPLAWVRPSNRGAPACTYAGNETIVDLSNSRPAVYISQEMSAGYVRGAGTTVEITFRVDLATLSGDGWVTSSPEAPIELFVWFLNPENGEKFFRQFNFNYRHDRDSNGRKIYWDNGIYSFELVEQYEWTTKIFSVADMEIPSEFSEVAGVMVGADGHTDTSYVSYVQVHDLESCPISTSAPTAAPAPAPTGMPVPTPPPPRLESRGLAVIYHSQLGLLYFLSLSGYFHRSIGLEVGGAGGGPGLGSLLELHVLELRALAPVARRRRLLG